MMMCSGFGSADWFHNYFENLTFEVAAGNPGAIALQFYSNNSDAVRDCRFIAATNSGLIGLDLAHRDMNGPFLVRNIEIEGFQTGISTGHAVNSQTFENILLRHQRTFGFDNADQYIAIRTYGTLSLLDAYLAGSSEAGRSPGIINYNEERLLLRDLVATGYARAVADVTTPDFTAAYRIRGADKPGTDGPRIEGYSTQAPISLFPSSARSLRLPVQETPEPPWEPLSAGANVDDFGADPSGVHDSSAAIHKAADSGATTLFLPGSYNLRSTVLLQGKVRRVIGLGGHINYGRGLRPDFRWLDGEAPTVFLEHFANIQGGLQIDTRRTVVLNDSSLFAHFGEACFNGNPFTRLVQETQSGQTRTLFPTQGHTLPFVGIPKPAP